MTEVSQLTGIPADRLYKWEKGTKPNDAEDLLKVREYLEGKLETGARAHLESVPKAEGASSMQILAMLAEAFKDQARAFADQAAIMKSIESKMAQELTQAKINERTHNMDVSLREVHGKVTTLWERQHLAIEEMREHFAKLGVRKIPASADAHKKRGQNGGKN